MCLSRVYEGQEKRTAINRLDIRVGGYIWLWKTYLVNDRDEIRPTNFGGALYEGLNKAKQKEISAHNFPYPSYKSGFHCFTTKKNARTWMNYKRNRVFVPVKVKKEWITSIGEQSGRRVVVCDKIII